MEQVVVRLPDFFIEEIIEEDNQAVLRVRYTGAIVCPSCGGTELRLKDSWTRRVRHHPIGDLCSVLEFRTGKYRCSCGRYFHPHYPGILKHQRSSEAFRKHVGERHEDGHCLAVISRRLRLSWATIERHYRHFLLRKAAEVQGNTSPRILGIDEHFFTKKKGFATTFVNLGTHKVQEVVLGRSEATLRRSEAKKVVPDLLFAIECLKDTPIASLQALGQTLDRWKAEIGRMWRFRKTNSITEGLHNKMELISRRAFGFRNFNNYRLRVKALCG